MSANAPNRLHAIPNWIIFICQYISTKIGIVGTNLVALAVSLITWLLTTSTTDREQSLLPSVVTSLEKHWPLYIGIWIAAEIIVIIGKLPVHAKSSHQLKREYLASLIIKTEDLTIVGNPMLYTPVKLDQIFIPLRLKPHQSTIDQLLTQENRKILREGIQAGHVAEEVEAVLMQAERDFARVIYNNQSIEIDDLWKGLTRQEPAAVIQGTPGMGKSTLLLRLALYMARRSKGMHDDIAKQAFSPTLIPIFISLGYYASYRQKTSGEKQKSLKAYVASLPTEMSELNSSDMVSWLENELSRGRCLVLFDALDEVSDAQERAEVQTAIQDFVREIRSQTNQHPNSDYNRFIITSRVAGYDPNAFPYRHYTLAELTEQQIREFLPRWCQASAQKDLQPVSADKQSIAKQAALIEHDLLDALENHQGVKEMAENPFLLTLLAIMRQNGIHLPHRRIELYTMVTRILLVDRNVRRNLPTIPEEQALQRLGPAAYQMQANKNSFISLREARSSIIEILTTVEHIPAEQAPQEADAFLTRMRERGGIFVFRAGDFLGFFHRTFQEYFAARHLMDRLANNPTEEQKSLLAKARDMSDTWREPFLLAMAYKNSEKSPDAQHIMKRLLTRRKGDSREQRAHDVLLAGQCLIEAKVATIPFALEQQTIQVLLKVYENAVIAKDTQTYKGIEREFISLLRGISNENQHSALLQTLQQTLKDTSDPASLHALLTLLLIIAPQLRRCADVIFANFVPPLLGLAGLPAIGKFEPMLPTSSPDFDTIDGALSVLRALGAAGPAGAALKTDKSRFGPYLGQLAQYSLERGLLTLTLIPSEQDNFERYGQAMSHWMKLKEKHRRSQEQDLQEAIDIQDALLQAAEELYYPVYKHFWEMLQRSQSQTDWQTIWQGYLSEQMEKGEYLDYQICALLWATLFPDPASQQALVSRLKEHFRALGPHQHVTRRFMLKLVSYSSDLHDLDYMRYLGDPSYLLVIDDLRYLRNLEYLSNLIYLRDMIYLRDIEYFSDSLYFYLRDVRNLIGLRDPSDLRSLNDLRDLDDLNNLNDLRALIDLRNLHSNIFTKSIGQQVEQLLQNCNKNQECIELLTLLLGRILQIQEGEEIGVEAEREVQHLVKVAITYRTLVNKTAEVVFDIIRSIPARTEREIAYILKLAQSEQDGQTQRACAEALQRSRPRNDHAWAMLEIAQTVGIPIIQEVAKQRLEWRRYTKV